MKVTSKKIILKKPTEFRSTSMEQPPYGTCSLRSFGQSSSEPNRTICGDIPSMKRFHQPDTEPYTTDRVLFLRNVLSQGLRGNISFGKSCIGYMITPTGISAKFSDGTSVKGTLLVGADGSNSQIRKHFLPTYQPYEQRPAVCTVGQILQENVSSMSLHILFMERPSATTPAALSNSQSLHHNHV